MQATPLGEFETDFWKDAGARATWDQIVPRCPA